MSIDLSEFHDVFFEECFEGLGVMESGLLTLDKGTDVEEINSIFRAAHSIKGGSASFGFMDISSFTHVMETLLDEMRDGRRQISQPIVDLLLESVDVLHSMVTAAKQGDQSDTARTSEVQQKLEAMLQSPGSDDAGSQACSESTDSPQTDKAAAQQALSQVRQIKFRPHPDMMKDGNDPARIFRELQKLADTTITVDTSALPALSDLEAESSYLSWTLVLHGDVEEADIRELFSWVEDASDLEITPLSTITSTQEVNETIATDAEPVITEAAVTEKIEAIPTATGCTKTATGKQSQGNHGHY